MTVDGEPAAMEDVSTAVADRSETATEPLVTRLHADGDVPYRYLDELQQEVVEGGVNRVVFRVTGGDEGGELAIVLPLPELGARRAVSGRNVLRLTVRPAGDVEVRRGEATQVQRIRAGDVAALWRQEVASNPLLIASVRHHPDVTYRQVMDVLDVLQEANAQRISLSGVAAQ